jgi:hypothetical protein
MTKCKVSAQTAQASLQFEFCIPSVQDLCPALETVAFPALISSSISIFGKCPVISYLKYIHASLKEIKLDNIHSQGKPPTRIKNNLQDKKPQ